MMAVSQILYTRGRPLSHGVSHVNYPKLADKRYMTFADKGRERDVKKFNFRPHIWTPHNLLFRGSGTTHPIRAAAIGQPSWLPDLKEDLNSELRSLF